MIELWDEKPNNNWKEIKMSRSRAKRRACIVWLLEMAGCLVIGAWFGWMYGKAF
jgi:hypothetical protein